jgi:hypothetical protein
MSRCSHHLCTAKHTIQIVRPSESTAETQPKLQPALGIVDHLRRREGTHGGVAVAINVAQ